MLMPSCVFCDGALGPETKPEHILLNALGGRMTTKQADCSECNNLFGGGIDNAFAGQVTEIRNLLQLESGTGRTAPSLKNVKAGDQTLNQSTADKEITQNLSVEPAFHNNRWTKSVEQLSLFKLGGAANAPCC